MSNSISGPSRPRTLDDRHDEPPPAPPPVPLRREYPLAPAGDRRSDAALVEFVRNRATAPATGAAASAGAAATAPKSAPLGPANDRILYVGLNPKSADVESGALRKLRPDTKAIVATGGDVLKHGGASFDLATADGRAAFTARLGLRGKTADEVATVLANVSAGGRGTVARIAVTWSAAEHGEAIPSRVVLSGHSNGRYVGGGGNMLEFGDVRALARALPHAARQIEDVHISGCFSNGNARDENATWRAAFPNMTTLWAYEEYAPGAPVHHLAAWEAMTRGRQDKVVPAPWLRAQSVACWSSRGGYVDRNVPLEALERSKRAADAAFDGLMAGSPRIASPRAEPAVSYYSAYRSLANRAERPDRQELAHRADQLLALRSYESTVRGRFADTYASEIDRGFRALGLPAPDLRTLTRAQAVAETRKFHEAIARANPVPAAARALEPLLRALDTLDPKTIRPEWSTHAG
ncbi:MAG: hypothetical protein KF764_09705 [Labilithrix sp.]|nr:hypothetical protein [Labilithrix sp.]